MAWLEQHGEGFRAVFRYGGKRFHHNLKTENRKEADALLGRLEYGLIKLERGELAVPSGADLCVFLLSDGKLADKPDVEKPLRLSEFFTRYRDSTNAKESNTRYTEGIHMDHLERLIGARTAVRGITTEILQAYVDARSAEDGKTDKVSHVTIKKEIGTFASIWNRWGAVQGLVTSPAPTKGLIYRKSKGKTPFQTWAQIERTIKRGGLTPAQKGELWDSLFLSTEQVKELLVHVRESGRADWVYPMFVFAARTGARRSEMVRSLVDDIDFDAKMVRIREKKKDQGKELTFRHVPLSPLLEAALREWFAKHPGGQFTFCQERNEPLTVAAAAHQFVRALEEGKWKVLKGWHVLRHSFASNCAAAGVDDRLIRSWMGHMTDEMASRYRHLFPDQQQKALSLVFEGQ